MSVRALLRPWELFVLTGVFPAWADWSGRACEVLLKGSGVPAPTPSRRGIPPRGGWASYLEGLGNQHEAGHPCSPPFPPQTQRPLSQGSPFPHRILCPRCFQLGLYFLLMAWGRRFYPLTLRIHSFRVGHVLKSHVRCVVINM